MPKKQPDGQWKVDFRPEGRTGKRFRKLFPNKAEAIRYETFIKNQFDRGEWNPRKTDKRRLSELATLWYDLHGKTLNSGHKRLMDIKKTIRALGDPISSQLTAKQYAKYRSSRLDAVTVSTANHDLMNIQSLFNELARAGEWTLPNPLESIRRLKQKDNELAYLDLAEIETLLTALDQHPDSHARITARVCLATGARWGEASSLKRSQIKNGKITFTGTKSGRNRSIPVSEEMERLVLDHAPLTDGYSTFKRVIGQLDLELPKGQMTHVLRHTFASHFMMNGGDILTLQRILDHSTLTMTIRYAHLAPDHLDQAVKMAPNFTC